MKQHAARKARAFLYTLGIAKADKPLEEAGKNGGDETGTGKGRIKW